MLWMSYAEYSLQFIGRGRKKNGTKPTPKESGHQSSSADKGHVDSDAESSTSSAAAAAAGDKETRSGNKQHCLSSVLDTFNLGLQKAHFVAILIMKSVSISFFTGTKPHMYTKCMMIHYLKEIDLCYVRCCLL